MNNTASSNLFIIRGNLGPSVLVKLDAELTAAEFIKNCKGTIVGTPVKWFNVSKPTGYSFASWSEMSSTLAALNLDRQEFVYYYPVTIVGYDEKKNETHYEILR